MITVATLRTWISDTVEENIIFIEREFTDTMLQECIDDVPDIVNMLSPLMTGAIPATDIPNPILRYGALANVFERAYIKAARNRSNLSEENIPVPVGENADYYKTLYNHYYEKFMTSAVNWKRSYDMLKTIQSSRQARTPYGYHNSRR